MRPNFLSWLKHGMMLTKKNFPTFVDTFNYMLGRIDNIKGDKDINPQSGVISVDNTDPDHPVIRCDVNKIPNVNGEKLVGDSDLTNASTYSVHVGKRTEQEGGETYATLYNFDQTPTESATATLDSNQGQYDVGSGDWFLVKNGNELKYKKITIETDLPGGGGGGNPDNVSINTRSSDSKEQIKDWDTATASGNTLATDLKSSSASTSMLVVRNADKSLSYKSIGVLGLPQGITQSGLKIVTDIQWNSTNHQLEIEHATVDIQNGVITSWNEVGDQTISTTSINSIINP